MEQRPFIQGLVTFSNHGTSTGIIPRFFNQILEIAQSALGKEIADKQYGNFLENGLKDFTDFYDLHKEIQEKYNDYNIGLRNGKYYSKNEKGQFKFDKSVEIEMERKIKDFFILGRLLINNFMKSSAIANEHFNVTKFMLVKDGVFKENKEKFLANEENRKFAILIEIIEQSREVFLSSFNTIRADIEHNQFKVPQFNVDTQTDEIHEPSIGGNTILINEIKYFYESILNMVEALLVYYFGVLLNEKQKFLGLFKRDEYDFTKMIYRFVVLPRMAMPGHHLLL